MHISEKNTTPNQASAPEPIKLFISYAHRDEDMRLELNDHLSNLQRQGLIASWHDRQIVAGEEWAGEIDEALNHARVILLLISARFMASDYCHDQEMLRAMERHTAGEAVVIPIILSDCDWQEAPFSKLQALPKEAKPIKSWADRDEAWANVARGIRRVIESLSRKSEPPQPYRTMSADVEQALPYLCNRSKQKSELEEALRQHRELRTGRPLLCVIHGDEYECHDKFLERLRTDLLPGLLNLKVAVEEFYWHEPPAPQASAQEFWRSLGERLLGSASHADETYRDLIVKKLTASDRPLLVNVGWLTENCVAHNDELFQSFLQFWEQWPALPAHRLVICGLSLTYQRSKDTTSKLRFWQKSPNERLRWVVEQLNAKSSDQFTLTVLSELHAITRKEAEDWPGHPKVRRQYDIPKDKITQLYRTLADRPIAMEELAPKLRELLNSETQLRN